MKTLGQDGMVVEELQKKIVQEKKWLMWLLKIWDTNDRKPSWVTIKRKWPQQYQLILKEVGPWDTVDKKLETAHEVQNRMAEEKIITELQKSRALDPRRKYSLEEHILGLIKLMNYLKIDRLPTTTEIAKYAKELEIPHKTSYERQLVTKENWYPCIQGYLAAAPGEREKVLREMEIELAKQRDARWKRDGMFKEKHTQRSEYSRERCLDDLSDIYDHFGCIPKRTLIDQYAKSAGRACYGTLLRHLGPMGEWPKLLAEYRARREIEGYLATCDNLEIEPPKRLDSLFERIMRVATVGEKMVWEQITERLRKATRKQPADFYFELNGKEYEVLIRPKG